MSDDELRTRRGKFLAAEKRGNDYLETQANGEVATYSPISSPLIRIEGLAFHTQVYAAGGVAKSIITGRTVEKIRAIGTEGDYQVYSVQVSSELAPGRAVIQKTFASDGHALQASVKLGLSEESVRELVQGILSLPVTGRIDVSGIKGMFYRSDKALLLPYWKESRVSEEREGEIRIGIGDFAFVISLRLRIPEPQRQQQKDDYSRRSEATEIGAGQLRHGQRRARRFQPMPALCDARGQARPGQHQARKPFGRRRAAAW